MKIEEESLLLLKCSENNWIALEKLIIKNHPYDVPCLVAYRSSHAYGPFEKWVDESHR